jgi:hypothetical protein
LGGGVPDTPSRPCVSRSSSKIAGRRIFGEEGVEEMTKLNLTEVTTSEIQRRLDFANTLIKSLIEHNRPGILPAHLEQERQELLAEIRRRKSVDLAEMQP